MSLVQTLLTSFINSVKDHAYTEDELKNILHSLPEYTTMMAEKKTYCSYVFSKGKDKDNECGEFTNNGDELCSRHKKTNHQGESKDAVYCDQLISRGDRKGQECGKKAVKGYTLCSSHKKSSMTTGEKTGSTTSKGEPGEAKPVVKCSYELKSGKNKGNECGTRVTDKSSSDVYCTKHAKIVGKDVPSPSSNTTGNTTTTTTNVSSSTLKLTFRKIVGTEYFLDKTQNIVFNNNKEVYASYMEGGGFGPLSQSQLDFVKKYPKLKLAEEALLDVGEDVSKESDSDADKDTNNETDKDADDE